MQEARKILTGQYQNIIIKEVLPLLIGYNNVNVIHHQVHLGKPHLFLLAVHAIKALQPPPTTSMIVRTFFSSKSFFLNRTAIKKRNYFLRPPLFKTIYFLSFFELISCIFHTAIQYIQSEIFFLNKIVLRKLFIFSFLQNNFLYFSHCS